MNKLYVLAVILSVGCAPSSKSTRITSVKTDAPVCASMGTFGPEQAEQFFERAKEIDGWPHGTTLPCDVEGRMLLKNKPVSFVIHPPSSAQVMDKHGGSTNYECSDCQDLFPMK